MVVAGRIDQVHAASDGGPDLLKAHDQRLA